MLQDDSFTYISYTIVILIEITYDDVNIRDIVTRHDILASDHLSIFTSISVRDNEIKELKKDDIFSDFVCTELENLKNKEWVILTEYQLINVANGVYQRFVFRVILIKCKLLC